MASSSADPIITPELPSSKHDENGNNNDNEGNDIAVETVSKRVKINHFFNSKSNGIKLSSPKPKNQRCNVCKQGLENIPMYNGHPNNSNEEFIALTDDKLSVFTGKEEQFNDQDDFPTHKVIWLICH